MALLLLSCSKTVRETPVPSFPVRLSVAEEKSIPIFLETLGHIEPMNQVQIRSRIEGQIMSLHFKEGSEVAKGDLLFTIDPRPYEAAAQKAKASLEENIAKATLAEEHLKRYASLVKKEYISQLDYEAIQMDYAAANALVRQNQADLDAALLNLDYCRIRSPIQGMTGILQIDEGNLVRPDNATPLISIKQIAPIYAVFSIPEIRLPDVQTASRKKHLSVLAAFENSSQPPIEGTLNLIDNAVDPATGMIKLRALFSNETRILWPGQFVRMRLILDTLDRAICIPYAAIQHTLSGPVVYCVTPDSTVQIRPVSLGQRDGDQVIVLEGLKAGETIAIDGQINLYEGARVYTPEERRSR